MIRFCLLFLIVFPLTGYSNENRSCLDSALKCEKFTEKYINRLENKCTNENMAYLGVAYIMKSNHASFPFTKLKYFYKGKKMLERAISIFPNNIEYIYYRYEIQIKIPKGLGYNNIKEDQQILKKFISNPDNLKKDRALFIQISKVIN